jgi:hypothetical protein
LIDGLAYAKIQLKRAEHLHNGDNNEAALRVMYTVFREFHDHGETMEAAYFKPRAYHLMARIHAALGNDEIAEMFFKRSIKKFNRDNFIGRGRVARDYGLWIYNQGGVTRGRNQIKIARKLLTQSTGDSERRRRETAITDDFLARVTIHNNPKKALEALQRTDNELRGCEKWIYELSYLEHWIPLIPLTTRPPYMLRAKKIRFKILFSTNLALLDGDIRSGKPIKALTGFGRRSLKLLF